MPLICNVGQLDALDQIATVGAWVVLAWTLWQANLGVPNDMVPLHLFNRASASDELASSGNAFLVQAKLQDRRHEPRSAILVGAIVFIHDSIVITTAALLAIFSCALLEWCKKACHITSLASIQQHGNFAWLNRWRIRVAS